MVKSTFINLKKKLDSLLKGRFLFTLGSPDAGQLKISIEYGVPMQADLMYRGRVLITHGLYEGYNGVQVGYCVDHYTRDWMCLVQFFDEGDIYAVPFDCLEAIEVAGRI